MSRILIVYESKYGQTEKIANFILDRLQSKGHSVDIVNLAKNKFAEPDSYDGVIVGSGIYGSHYPKNILKWAKRNSSGLNKKTSAFFSVCLAVVEKQNEKVQKNLSRIEDKFFQKTLWYSKMHTIFAGALAYSRYGWVVKQMMRLISRAGGGETDTSRDYEYTNWSDVTRFADEFANALPVTRRERGTEISP